MDSARGHPGRYSTAAGELLVNESYGGAVDTVDFLIPSLSARENVAAPLLVAGTGKAEALRRADQILEEVGMADRRDHKPKQLSGGQQRGPWPVAWSPTRHSSSPTNPPPTST